MALHNTHYEYQKDLERVWKNAVRRYKAEKPNGPDFFKAEELAFLAGIGLTGQEMFDYAEDYSRGGDPDFANVAAVTDIRRSYFLEVQKGKPTGKTMNMATLPPKDAEVNGIKWLPRLIVKARAKLAGELDPDIMYGCGGDRNFFRTCDVHPAEFLRVVQNHPRSDAPIVAWLEKRRNAAAKAAE